MAKNQRLLDIDAHIHAFLSSQQTATDASFLEQQFSHCLCAKDRKVDALWIREQVLLNEILDATTNADKQEALKKILQTATYNLIVKELLLEEWDMEMLQELVHIQNEELAARLEQILKINADEWEAEEDELAALALSLAAAAHEQDANAIAILHDHISRITRHLDCLDAFEQNLKDAHDKHIQLITNDIKTNIKTLKEVLPEEHHKHLDTLFSLKHDDQSLNKKAKIRTFRKQLIENSKQPKTDIKNIKAILQQLDAFEAKYHKAQNAIDNAHAAHRRNMTHMAAQRKHYNDLLTKKRTKVAKVTKMTTAHEKRRALMSKIPQRGDIGRRRSSSGSDPKQAFAEIQKKYATQEKQPSLHATYEAKMQRQRSRSKTKPSPNPKSGS